MQANSRSLDFGDPSAMRTIYFARDDSLDLGPRASDLFVVFVLSVLFALVAFGRNTIGFLPIILHRGRKFF